MIMEFIETSEGIYRKSEIKSVYKYEKNEELQIIINLIDSSYLEITFKNESERELEYNKIKEQLLK